MLHSFTMFKFLVLQKMNSTSKPQNVLLSEFTTPGYIKFIFGGLSGMGATLFVQPLDLVKNRLFCWTKA
jgi:hypothetical protein